MKLPLGAVAGFLLLSAASIPAPLSAQSQSVPSIRRVQLLRSGGQLQLEIEASDRVVPQVNEIANPDRLVVDFVNAVPGAQLRNQKIHRGEVKSLRVGLFSSDPPVTRVVLDLNSPQTYEVFQSGRTVIVKVGDNAGEQAAVFHPASAPTLINTAQAVRTASLVTSAGRALEVSFHEGLLSISANKASLSEVLYEIHQRTGADIAIPAGAEQEKVMVELGPAPAPEVLAHLLNGSKFNFLIVSSSTNPLALDQVILSPRAEGMASSPRPQAQPVAEVEDEAAVSPPNTAQEKPETPQAENPSMPPNGQASPAKQPGNDVPD